MNIFYNILFVPVGMVGLVCGFIVRVFKHGFWKGEMMAVKGSVRAYKK